MPIADAQEKHPEKQTMNTDDYESYFKGHIVPWIVLGFFVVSWIVTGLIIGHFSGRRETDWPHETSGVSWLAWGLGIAYYFLSLIVSIAYFQCEIETFGKWTGRKYRNFCAWAGRKCYNFSHRSKYN